jgi:hypothetical protein
VKAVCVKCGRGAHNGLTNCDGMLDSLTPEEIQLEATAVEADVKLPYLVAMFWLAGRELRRTA